MSATNTTTDDASTATEFTIPNVQEYLDISVQPASAIIDALDGWEAIRQRAEDGDDWEDINGVGPATADAIEEADFGSLPAGGPSSPDQPSPSSVDEDSDDTDAEEGEEVSEPEPEEDGEETKPDVESEDDEDTATDDESGDPDVSEDTDEEAESEDDSQTGSEDGVGQDEEEDTDSLFDARGAPSEFTASIPLNRLQGIFGTIGHLVDECKFRLGAEKVGARAVDPANVGMVDIQMHHRAFDSYRGDEGVLGLNVERVNSILSMGNSDSTVHLELLADVRKLKITIDGVEYTMALIDPDSIRQEPDLPDLELSTTIEMESSVFDRGVTASDMVSDHMGLEFSRDEAAVVADGDTDDVNLDLLEQDGVVDYDSTADRGDSALFSLDYLKKVERMVPKNDTVTLRVGDEFPIKVHFQTADNHATVEAMIAPRIEA